MMQNDMGYGGGYGGGQGGYGGGGGGYGGGQGGYGGGGGRGGEGGGGGGGRRPRDPQEQMCKLFIGGLDYNTDANGLKSYFKKYGSVNDVVVLKDTATNKSRGFGFVTFDKPECVDNAQSERPHHIDGKKVDTKRALARDNAPGQNKPVKKMFVGGLPRGTTEDMMREVFCQYGEITDIAVVKDKATGEPRGFGFVTFDDHDDVDSCLVKNQCKINLNGKMVDIKKAVPPEEGGRGGGGGGGGGGRYRSPSPRRRRRSRSRSRSRDRRRRSRSNSHSRSRSTSRDRRRRTRSNSRDRKKTSRRRSRSPSKSKSRSRSKSVGRSPSKSRSRSPKSASPEQQLQQRNSRSRSKSMSD